MKKESVIEATMHVDFTKMRKMDNEDDFAQQIGIMNVVQGSCYLHLDTGEVTIERVTFSDKYGNILYSGMLERLMHDGGKKSFVTLMKEKFGDQCTDEGDYIVSLVWDMIFKVDRDDIFQGIECENGGFILGGSKCISGELVELNRIGESVDIDFVAHRYIHIGDKITIEVDDLLCSREELISKRKKKYKRGAHDIGVFLINVGG